MHKVGLTGSIAVGKSFVSQVLAEMGCAVLDADLTAREVVAPGSEGLHQIVAEFGSVVLHTDGSLDRAKLGTIVFSDEDKRAKLNKIVHPLVWRAQDEWLRQIAAAEQHAIAVIDAALLIESGGYKRFDKIIVVWCEPEIQIARLMARNNLDRATAEQRIKAQMPQDEKKRYADFLIDTSKGFEDTRRQTEEIYRELLSLRS